MYMTRDEERELVKKWDASAKPYTAYEERSPYVREFIEKSGLKSGESVFDMGCGSGTLCVPLAEDGYTVFAGDFSEEMLNSVREVMAQRNLKGLTLKKMSFLDDWDSLDLPKCDYVFASRCLTNTDPAVILPKLSAQANKRVCITIHVNTKDGVLSGIPYKGKDSLNYLKACFNTLVDMGYFPHVELIGSMFSEKKGGWVFISWDV